MRKKNIELATEETAARPKSVLDRFRTKLQYTVVTTLGELNFNEIRNYL